MRASRKKFQNNEKFGARFRLMFAVVLLSLCGVGVGAPENGKLQIHFMHVGQGDGALVVSPSGETVLFDSGDRGHADLPISYLQQLGVRKIDYHIASHYHDDHIGCVLPVLAEFPLQVAAYDRGDGYKSKTFSNYVAAVGILRATAYPGSFITLDATSTAPVRIEFVSKNGNGVSGANDENDRSLVCVLRFGQFDAVFGGDLSGSGGFLSKYKDVETSVAPLVGEVEVYKANHHGSRYSSNNNWLSNTTPQVAVISCGLTNGYDHPHPEALTRLHNYHVHTYWTSGGDGLAVPDPNWDHVGGNIVVEVAPNSTQYTVTYAGTKTDSYTVWHPITPPAVSTTTSTNNPPAQSFAWSELSSVYHISNCVFVANISPNNLRTGSSPPAGKRIHFGCPK